MKKISTAFLRIMGLMGFFFLMILTIRTSEAALILPKVEYSLPYPGILPDHLLYPVKMLRDKIMLLLINDKQKKAEVYLLLADKRLGAGKVLMDGGKTQLAVETLSKAEKYLEQAVLQSKILEKESKEIAALLEKLDLASQKHLEILQEMIDKASETTKQELLKSLDLTTSLRQQLLTK